MTGYKVLVLSALPCFRSLDRPRSVRQYTYPASENLMNVERSKINPQTRCMHRCCFNHGWYFSFKLDCLKVDVFTNCSPWYQAGAQQAPPRTLSTSDVGCVVANRPTDRLFIQKPHPAHAHGSLRAVSGYFPATDRRERSDSFRLPLPWRCSPTPTTRAL